ncbi:hypothetical protein [Pseudoalteromonas gelatinilytica]|tara:strand:- start:2532 stop:3608 length:1077 start_codon:yes stop_codon:yes gene_type:complete
MSEQFNLCFSTQSRAVLPIDINNKEAYKQFRKDNPHIFGSFIPAGTPFILSEPGSKSVKNLRANRPDLACALDSVNSWSQSTKRNITKMANDFGSDNTFAIAELYEKELQPYLKEMADIMSYKVDSIAASGAAATAINSKEARLSNFGKALFKYQKSLMAIRAAAKNKAPKHELVKLGYKAKAAHLEVSERFTRELSAIANRVKSGSRGNIWSNPQRGINIAKSARNAAPIQVTSLSGIRSLRSLEVGSSVLGNGLIALDAAVRADKIYGDYKSGADWHRTLVVETTGFGASTAAGLHVGARVVALGAGIAIAAGPVGWVILIGVGLAAGYGAAKVGDYIGQSAAGKVYDTSSNKSFF